MAAFAPRPPSLQEVLESSHDEAPRAVLTGPRSSGKTSLLFSHAHRLAAAGETVLFVARRQVIELQPPLPVVAPGAPARDDNAGHGDGDELARIHMKYLKSGADVEWLLDSLPLLCADGAGVDAARLPNAIIIDDLDELLLAREVGAAAPAGCAATAEHGGLFPSSDAALSRALRLLHTLAHMADTLAAMRAPPPPPPLLPPPPPPPPPRRRRRRRCVPLARLSGASRGHVSARRRAGGNHAFRAALLLDAVAHAARRRVRARGRGARRAATPRSQKRARFSEAMARAATPLPAARRRARGRRAER